MQDLFPLQVPWVFWKTGKFSGITFLKVSVYSKGSIYIIWFSQKKNQPQVTWRRWSCLSFITVKEGIFFMIFTGFKSKRSISLVTDITPPAFFPVSKQVSPMQSFPVPPLSEVLATFNTLSAHPIATNRTFWLFFFLSFFPHPHMPGDHKKLNTLNPRREERKKIQIDFILHMVLRS